MESAAGPVHGHAYQRNDHSAKGKEVIRALIRQVNERYFECLCRDRSHDLAPVCLDPRVWNDLNPAAKAKLAHFPVLMLNLRFQDLEWWKSISVAAEDDARVAPSGTIAPPTGAVMLSRHVLLLAWHSAFYAKDALLLLGIRRTLGQRIAELTLHDIDRIAARYWMQLRPRWDEHEDFWRALLHAASDFNEERWRELQLHGLQLLGRDLLADLG